MVTKNQSGVLLKNGNDELFKDRKWGEVFPLPLPHPQLTVVKTHSFPTNFNPTAFFEVISAQTFNKQT